MSEQQERALTRAYELVENDKLDEARALLEPILAADEDNADAWWIYAHAVTEPSEARRALENVTRLDPDYPGAAELLATVKDMTPALTPASRTPAPPVISAPPTAPPPTGRPVDEPNFFEPSPPEVTLPKESVRARRSPLPLVLVGIILLALVAVVVILLTQQDSAAPTPTPAVQVATVTDQALQGGVGTEQAALPGESTEQAGTTPDPAFLTATALILAETGGLETPIAQEATEDAVEATDSAPVLTVTEAVTEAALAPTDDIALATPPVEVTEEATAPAAVNNDTLLAALSDLPLAPQNPLVQETTSEGEALVLNVCGTRGRELRTLLPQAMNAYAAQATALDEAFPAIGVRVVDCATNETLLRVIVNRNIAVAFASGAITEGEFAGLWRSQ